MSAGGDSNPSSSMAVTFAKTHTFSGSTRLSTARSHQTVPIPVSETVLERYSALSNDDTVSSSNR